MRAMTSPTVHPAQRIVELGFGFILSGALSSVAEPGVADKLAQGRAVTSFPKRGHPWGN